MTGSTYDAKHLDMFINKSKFAESNEPNDTDFADSVARHKSFIADLPNYLVHPDSIKPSTAFLNQPRSKIPTHFYVDLMSGPSTLQKRD